MTPQEIAPSATNSAGPQQRHRSSTAASSILHDSSQSSTVTSQRPASAQLGFTQHHSNRRSGNQSRKSSGSNVGSTEILGGSRYTGLRRQMSADTPSSSPNVVHTAIKQLKEERWTVTDPYRLGSEKTSDRAWKECTEAAVKGVEGQCKRTLKQIQQLKFTAMCVCSLLVCVRLWVFDAKPSSNWLGNISADNPAALCILFSSLSLSFLQIAERWTQGCIPRTNLPMNQVKRFVLVQRRKYYMQYGIIPLLLSVAHRSADIAMWILFGIVFGNIGDLGKVLGGTAMIIILTVKAGSVVCPTIKFLRTAPAASAVPSPFRTWPVSLLEIIFTSMRAGHSSPTTSSQVSNHDEKPRKKIEPFTYNWKFGMGFGSDLELCVPGLLELVISQRCKVSDVIACLSDYSKAYPRLLIHDIWKITRGEVASPYLLQEDLAVDMQDPELTKHFVRDFLIAIFLRQAASVDEQLDNSRSVTRFRVELFCQLFHSSMNNPKALAMTQSIFTLSKAFKRGLTSESRAGKFDNAFNDCLTQLLRVATVALEKGIDLADLNSFLEELIPSLLSPDAALTVRVGGGITAFTAVWANSIANDNGDVEKFRRYRDSLKALRSGERPSSDFLKDVELALDYKKDRAMMY